VIKTLLEEGQLGVLQHPRILPRRLERQKSRGRQRGRVPAGSTSKTTLKPRELGVSPIQPLSPTLSLTLQ